MRAIGAVDKGRFPVVAPRSRKVYRAVRNTLIPCKAAAVEHKSYLLFGRVRGSGDVTVTSHIVQRLDLAVFKQRVAAAEYKVHGARDKAVLVDLTRTALGAELVLEEAVVSYYKVGVNRFQR